jgi:hypothetical protein
MRVPVGERDVDTETGKLLRMVIIVTDSAGRSRVLKLPALWLAPCLLRSGCCTPPHSTYFRVLSVPNSCRASANRWTFLVDVRGTCAIVNCIGATSSAIS